MGSQWTDKSAIMRDLSFAQGRWVPGGIDAAVANGKPPINNITEETEEEYFKRWTTDGDFSIGPDLSMISKMLEMVDDELPDSQDIRTGSIEIKKLNPVAKVFVPKFKKTEVKEVQEKQVKPIREKTNKTKKPLRERNVAIASIIANSINIPQDVGETPIKLSKPEDFIKTSSFVPKMIDKEEVDALSRRKDSVNKVNSWLQSQDMSSMFKKKSTESVKSPIQSDISVKSPQNAEQQYVPSSWAGEYYKKCVDRTHIRDMVQENVWARAEKIMKEIDVRKAEEQRCATEGGRRSLGSSPGSCRPRPRMNDECNKIPVGDSQGIGLVLLPQHRHLLTGTCIVCEVLSKRPAEKELVFESEPNDDEKVKPELQDITNELEVVEKVNENEEDFFCLVRSRVVENLADLDAVEQNTIPLDESDSTEILDVTSES